jgi:hypothetical protein
MSTLEQTLTALAAQHDLSTIEVSCMFFDNRVVWKAGIHWEGFSQRDISYSAGRSDNNIAEAIQEAIEKSRPDRFCPIKVGTLDGFQPINDVHLDRAA